MTILTRREKTRAVRESLFKPINGQSLGALKKSRFDRGKYKPDSMAGKPVPDHMREHVLIVWVERAKDSHGPYDALFCFSKTRV